MLLLLFLSHQVHSLESSFNEGKQVAESAKNGIGDQIRSGVNKGHVPQYQDGFSIDKEELSRSFERLEQTEHGRDLRDIHKSRKPYILDDTEDFMVRSESIHQTPEKVFEESEEIEEGIDGLTIETCEECPNEEYFVKARMIKERDVRLKTPAYIIIQANSESLMKIELTNASDDVFRDDGLFNITHLYGETYRTNGVDIILKKTVLPFLGDGVVSNSQLLFALQARISAETMITKLLGSMSMEQINLGAVVYGGSSCGRGWSRSWTVTYTGCACVFPRTVEDTGEHYWLPDDAYKHYEGLCNEGLCRYESFEDDPPSDKFWKGKKINGSWGRTMTFACRSSCKDTCVELRARGCSREPNPECLEEKGGKCLRWKWTFKCKDKVAVAKYKFSKKNPFCLGGDCIDSSYESDRDMIQALGYLSILEEARKEMDGTANIQVFKGESHGCNKIRLGAGIKDCCGTYKGLGVSLGLTKCDEDAKTLAKLRGEGKCVYVGTHCAEEINVGLAKFCLREKTSFCCFGTKFAKLLQEQGKPQLDMSFGDPKCPDCRGFTPEELSRIDFSKLDLTEITADVIERFKPENEEHFAKEGELERIREQMEWRVKKTDVPESMHLQENMKHLTGSLKVGVVK